MAAPISPDRSAGVLLHPTSLPGPYGIGDIGPTAYDWIDRLARSGQKWWQVLPTGPTGYGDSPYQSFSAFAGNLNLISPDLLAGDGLICADDYRHHSFSDDRVDYARVGPLKEQIVRQAWENYRAGHVPEMKGQYEQFCQDQKDWLADYSLFMTLKEYRHGASWNSWPKEFLRRDSSSAVFDFARTELAEETGRHQFGQFLFYRQWQAMRDRARSRGIKIIGDIPIFVSGDSADVWANPKMFVLDSALRAKVVAGVPPDYFSPTGQLWGNPLYDWEAMKATGYSWWIARMRATFELVDLVRLDHFRGFCAAWHIPAGQATAEHGRWVPGPGRDLFEVLKKTFGNLPIIAEDLGEITPDVYALRDEFDLPGMKVLQFAFDEPANPFLPHNYTTARCVVYPGTHDNDTTRGWYAEQTEQIRWNLHRYLNRDGSDVAWDLIRMSMASVASLAIIAAQDILDLGTECRMNMPGRPEGNWQWRMRSGAFHEGLMDRLAGVTELYGRTNR